MSKVQSKQVARWAIILAGILLAKKLAKDWVLIVCLGARGRERKICNQTKRCGINYTMENSFDYSKSILGKELQSQELPFLILPKLKRLIEQIGPSLPQEDYLQTQPQVWIHKTAKVSPNAVILPPCIICQNAEIRTNAYLRGGVVVGANAQVGNCVEIKNTLMFDGVKIPHLSYVGDSILSSNVHLGAGVIISNVRADKGQITHNNIKTGLTKMGAIIHQNAEIGCNAVISPGTLVGQNSRVYPTTLARGVVPPNSILKNNGQIVPLKPQIQPPKGEKQ